MSAIFGKDQKYPVATPPPQVDHYRAQSAAQSERLKTRSASGRASTMLTGGKVEESETATKKLMGGTT